MKTLLVVIVFLGLATSANAQSRYWAYVNRSNRAEAQKRYDASRSDHLLQNSRNYAKPVPRRDFFPSPTQRMQQFPDSSRSTYRTGGPTTTPVYGEKGKYLGTVTDTTKGTQIFRDDRGRLLSRSQLDRRGTRRYFFGSSGQFQGRTGATDNTSSMERFLEGR